VSQVVADDLTTSLTPIAANLAFSAATSLALGSSQRSPKTWKLPPAFFPP